MLSPEGGQNFSQSDLVFPIPVRLFPSFTLEEYKHFPRFVFLTFLYESLLMLNQGHSKTMKTKAPSGKNMQMLVSSLGLCGCLSCAKQMACLLSQISSSLTFNPNSIFLGKICLNKLHFKSTFSKKTLPNISRTTLLKTIWKFKDLNIIQSMTLLFS